MPGRVGVLDEGMLGNSIGNALHLIFNGSLFWLDGISAL